MKKRTEHQTCMGENPPSFSVQSRRDQIADFFLVLFLQFENEPMLFSSIAFYRNRPNQLECLRELVWRQKPTVQDLRTFDTKTSEAADLTNDFRLGWILYGWASRLSEEFEKKRCLSFIFQFILSGHHVHLHTKQVHADRKGSRIYSTQVTHRNGSSVLFFGANMVFPTEIQKVRAAWMSLSLTNFFPRVKKRLMKNMRVCVFHMTMHDFTERVKACRCVHNLSENAMYRCVCVCFQFGRFSWTRVSVGCTSQLQ